MKSREVISLAEINPELSKQWHPIKNGKLTPNDVTPGVSKKVWWLCEKEHEWQASVNNRSKGNKCPFCSGRFASADNSLHTLNPKLSKQWHPTKNGNLTPDDVTIKSSKRVWWLCENHHEWEAVIYSRSDGNGCPFCAGQRLCDSNSLQALNPILSKQWHPTKNNGLTPNNVLPSASKKVWWLCEKGHEWQATVNKRANGRGCPFCSYKLVSSDNSLQVLYPELSKQWHPSKNGDLTPNDVSKGSNKKVWWLCEKGHEWEASIVNRAIHGRGCSDCNYESQTSFPEQAIYFYLKKHFSDALNRYKHDDKWEIDIFIPSLNFGIEYDGFYYHEKSGASDEKKEKQLYDSGICILRIKETPENIGNCYKESNVIYCAQRPSDFQLNEVIIMCINSIGAIATSIPKSCAFDIDVAKDRAKINDLYILNEKQNSFSAKYPKIANEWHPTKNFNVMPNMVKAKSNKKFWWQCEKGHAWEATVNSRVTMQSGCPFCVGRQANFENCLQTLNPNLAKQWHPLKNNNLTPKDVTTGSKIKVWWLCEEEHEWESTINNRVKGNGCPFCSGRLVHPDKSLQILNPDLAKQWHPDKNKGLTPFDVAQFSNKKIWWQCANGHEWEATVAKRSNGRTYNIKVVSETELNTKLLNCPVCGTFKAFLGG
ncbi:MAG: zinc-ribbon domain-containing protein, partial [Defluviitaleaceae bacterium]|nr:zinc-ribbon domain-containing protein [Defluviitaleaceae bacterium]